MHPISAPREAPPRYARQRHAKIKGKNKAMLSTSVATVTIRGISPYSQSRQHDEPMLEGESRDDYDKRTWRSKMSIAEIQGRKTVVIPAHGIHQALMSGAKYSKRQIPGQGKATWTKKFEAGIMLMGDAALNIDPDTVGSITISANADGVRGSGKRVPRRFPEMPPPWEATFEVAILDPIITEDVFREMLAQAGMFIGLGRFRPEKGGGNGRFQIKEVVWQDNRQLAA